MKKLFSIFIFLFLVTSYMHGSEPTAADRANAFFSQMETAAMDPNRIEGLEDMIMMSTAANMGAGMGASFWHRDVIPGVNVDTMVGWLYRTIMIPLMAIALGLNIIQGMSKGGMPDWVDITFRTIVIIIFGIGAQAVATVMMTLQNGLPAVVMMATAATEEDSPLGQLLNAPPMQASAKITEVANEVYRHYLSQTMDHGLTPSLRPSNNDRFNVDYMTPRLMARVTTLNLPENVKVPSYPEGDINEFYALERTEKGRMLANLLQLHFTYDPDLRQSLESSFASLDSTFMNPSKWGSRTTGWIRERVLGVVGMDTGETEEGFKQHHLNELRADLNRNYADSIANLGILRSTTDNSPITSRNGVQGMLGSVANPPSNPLIMLLMNSVSEIAAFINKWVAIGITTLAGILLRMQFVVLMITLPLFLYPKWESPFKTALNVCFKLIVWPSVAGALLIMWSMFCKSLYYAVMSPALHGTMQLHLPEASMLSATVGAASGIVTVGVLVAQIVGTVFIAFASLSITNKILQGGSVGGALLGTMAKAGIAGGLAAVTGGAIMGSTIAAGANAAAGGAKSMYDNAKTKMSSKGSSSGETGSAGGGGDSSAADVGSGGSGGGGGSAEGGSAATGHAPDRHSAKIPQQKGETQNTNSKSLQEEKDRRKEEVEKQKLNSNGVQIGAKDKGLYDSDITGDYGSQGSSKESNEEGADSKTETTANMPTGGSNAETSSDKEQKGVNGNVTKEGSSNSSPTGAASTSGNKDNVSKLEEQAANRRRSKKEQRISSTSNIKPEEKSANSSNKINRMKAVDMAKSLGRGTKHLAVFGGKVAANVAMIPTSRGSLNMAGSAMGNIAAFTASKGDMQKLFQYKMGYQIMSNLRGNASRDDVKKAAPISALAADTSSNKNDLDSELDGNVGRKQNVPTKRSSGSNDINRERADKKAQAQTPVQRTAQRTAQTQTKTPVYEHEDSNYNDGRGGRIPSRSGEDSDSIEAERQSRRDS